MANFNQNVETLIANFAKANKVSKVKLEALVTECVTALTESTHSKKVGRVAAILAIRQNIQSNSFTVKEAQKVWGITYIGAVKRIERLAEEGLLERAGTDINRVGKGRKPDLWVATV